MLSAVVGRTYNVDMISCRLPAKSHMMHQGGDEVKARILGSIVTAETDRFSGVTVIRHFQNHYLWGFETLYNLGCFIRLRTAVMHL
jgi:hypothetical protein